MARQARGAGSAGIAKAPSARVYLTVPHNRQSEFVHSGSKRKMVRAGRRSGKTTGVGILAGKRFLEDARVLYAGPTADQLNAFWNAVKVMFAEAIDAGVYHINEAEHVLERPLLASRKRVRIPSQNRIRAKTAWNADTMRGDYGDEVIFDEYQMMAEDSWGLVGAPMLLDNNGNATFCYTPPNRRQRSVSKAKDKLHAAKLFKFAQTNPRWQAFHFTSLDNPYLSSEALDEVAQDMTAEAYRMEILAEDIEEAPNSLWKRAMFGLHRIRTPQTLVRVVVAVDPTGTRAGDEAGIIVAGLGGDGNGYVMTDDSIGGASPQQWGARVISAYHEYQADRVIGETNFGGDMVESTLRVIDPDVSYQGVSSSRGKAVRAEPIAALYERNRVFHVQEFPDLEDQLCMWTPDSGWSPDRLDALVFALTELMLKPAWSVVIPD